jgi:RNA polymerase sigma factor (sigma-70 family)
LSLTAAKRFRGSALSLEDRVQVCHVALIRIIDTIDPDRISTTIVPYLYRVMRHALIQAEAEQTHAVQLHHFAVWLMKHPVEGQPLTRTQRAVLGASKPAVSLDTPLPSKNGDSMECLGDRIPQQTFPAPDAGLNLASSPTDITSLLVNLTTLERQVIELTYGLGADGLEHTPAEIGALLDMTPQQAGRYVQIALKKLRKVPVAITTPHRERWWRNRAS